MPTVQTVRGPIDTAALGRTFMHEHIAIRGTDVFAHQYFNQFHRLGVVHFGIDIRVAAGDLGAVALDRSAELAGPLAPDFQLPDLEGQLHSLSDQRGKQVLLIAYASW